ncbi:selenium cofactor biosynthesis protein YqeC [Salidesulfovibrio onnuriiensis]|uniref:selenium cofactor biosynthesis protein YqeC n=1 Tax=Salidesulfovibrio onnuriiensis TaxID=2583823 RepID=UPI0011C73EF1|nr:selenium cofactor biosynthesis protein YqeC [Salidesulfovibrio onnuriiensis]
MLLQSIAELVNPGDKVISITGAGGKTSLMYLLANELADSGKRVITTTTTRIVPPHRDQTGGLVLKIRNANFLKRIKSRLDKARHVTAAYRTLHAMNKLEGLDPIQAQELPDQAAAAHIVIEADGAARKPLKAPADHEPVVPPLTSLHIGVMGLDSIGMPLDDEHVFRPERIAEIAGVQVGDTVTPDVLAHLAVHELGAFKGCPEGARKVLVLNKADRTGSEEQAHEVIRAARELPGGQPDTWIIASVKQKQFELIF